MLIVEIEFGNYGIICIDIFDDFFEVMVICNDFVGLID